MKLVGQEIKQQKELIFHETIDLKNHLQEVVPDILDITLVQVRGTVAYRDALYFLDYTMTYEITLASSRSLKPVSKKEERQVQEIFAETDDKVQEIEEQMGEILLPLKDGELDLFESVVDNIVLAMPLQVLTPEEEGRAADLSGNNWNLLSEEAYQKEREESRVSQNPFNQLANLVSDEDEG